MEAIRNVPMLVAWTTTPDRQQAESLAAGLVHAGLVACAQISGPIHSYYRWKDTVEADEEFRLTLKTPADCWEPLTQWVHEHHPYDTPQWIAVETTQVSRPYREWAEGCTHPS